MIYWQCFRSVLQSQLHLYRGSVDKAKCEQAERVMKASESQRWSVCVCVCVREKWKEGRGLKTRKWPRCTYVRNFPSNFELHRLPTSSTSVTNTLCWDSSRHTVFSQCDVGVYYIWSCTGGNNPLHRPRQKLWELHVCVKPSETCNGGVKLYAAK